MASLPEELQPEIQRMMVTLRKEIPTTSLGEIYQIALAALDKFCETQNMFKQLQKRSQKLKGAYNKSYLQIKCKDKDSCECNTKKMHHFRKSSQPFQSKSNFPRHAISLQDDDFEDIIEEQLQKDADTQYVLHMSDSDSCSDSADYEDEYMPIHAVTAILP
ncbi:hypothetical protein PIB30_029989 [Stylosanthes scabra]|uniref:Uncharacterized protein n=1 Tax=Stylosanthes scabra TaxID=79078 RepID=A0ABU6Z888_9FABA|nr:hypothetical protein [Stylosanthes scabra]